MIKSVTMFETMGKLFPTVQKAQEYREGLVETFLRSCPGFYDIPHKQRISFVQSVIDGRKQLSELLDYNTPTENEG